MDCNNAPLAFHGMRSDWDSLRFVKKKASLSFRVFCGIWVRSVHVPSWQEPLQAFSLNILDFALAIEASLSVCLVNSYWSSEFKSSNPLTHCRSSLCDDLSPLVSTGKSTDPLSLPGLASETLFPTTLSLCPGADVCRTGTS